MQPSSAVVSCGHRCLCSLPQQWFLVGIGACAGENTSLSGRDTAFQDGTQPSRGTFQGGHSQVEVYFRKGAGEQDRRGHLLTLELDLPPTPHFLNGRLIKFCTSDPPL